MIPITLRLKKSTMTTNTDISPLGIAVVTGASSGIGKVYADRLAKRGYDLLLVARRKDRLQNLAQELESQYGINAKFIVADLGDAVDLKRISDTITADPRVSLLVNNAGMAAMGPSAGASMPDIEAQLDVNAKAVSHLSLALLPEFLKRDSGTIINIGSVLSFAALPFSTSYSATKAHVLLFTIGLQQEVADTKVRVHLVLPSATATEIWEVSGIGLSALDPKTVMTAEDCVDAALAGLDQGEAVTLPSVEDGSLWAGFDAIRHQLLGAAQSGQPASRYGIVKKEPATV